MLINQDGKNYEVLENGQVLQIEEVGSAIIETPVQKRYNPETEELEDIIVPEPEPPETIEQKLARIENTVDLILLKQEGIL